MKVLGFNFNSIIIEDNGIFKEIKISTKSYGENQSDSYYSDNETIIVNVVETTTKPTFQYLFINELTDKDILKINTLLSYKENQHISMNIFDTLISYEYVEWEGQNAHLDLSFAYYGHRIDTFLNTKTTTTEKDSTCTTEWFNTLEDFLSFYSENDIIFIDNNCSYKNDLNNLIKLANI